MRYGLACFLMLFWSTSAFAQSSHPLRFYVWAENLAPIIAYSDREKGFSGIVVDLFDSLAEHENLDIRYVIHNRTRGEQALYAGDFHATILSREWLAEPDKLLFSLPIYVHVEYMYGTEPIPNTSLNRLVRNQHICTRRGYRYPKLKRFFDKRLAMRTDTHSEEAMLRMLLLGRCDFAISNEFVAGWLIEQNGWQNKIYLSPSPIDKVNFTLAFHPSKASILVALNTHIENMTKSGQLAGIIRHHREKTLQLAKRADTD